MKNRTTKSNSTRFFFVTAVALALILPTLDRFFALDPIPKQSENRRWTEPPGIPKTREQLDKWGSEVGNYFSDHFGFRNALIRIHNFLKVKVFGHSSSDLVLVGNNDWLLWIGENSLPFYRNLKPFHPEELKAWIRVIKEQQDWLDQQGIAFQVMICPDPPTVYPESLPRWAKPLPGPTRREALIAELNKFMKIPVVDLGQVLREKKAARILYRKTDSHWNDFGGFYSMQANINILRTRFSNLPELTTDMFEFSEVQTSGEDLSRVMGLGEFFVETSVKLKPKHAFTKTEEEGRDYTTINPKGVPFEILMFRDSYGVNLEPSVSGYFSKVRYVWDNLIPIDQIRKYKPKLVVWQMVERKLTGIPRPNPDTLKVQK